MIADRDSLNRIQKEMQLTDPIMIKFVPTLGATLTQVTLGTYKHTASGHLVLILDTVDCNKANDVFWHEIGHARQSEEDTEFLEKYRQNVTDVGYRKSQYEQDADAQMRMFRHRLPDPIFPF